MITGMEIAACQHMAVPAEVMQHVVNVESGYNPFAIGVVGGQLVRQPQNIGEAIATVEMLESKGYNFSLGLAQVNRANLSKYGLTTYQQAFDICPNLIVGARILSECYANSGNDWGKSFSCYYSGNFITGYRDGYVQKMFDSINGTSLTAAVGAATSAVPIQLTAAPSPSSLRGSNIPASASILQPDSASYRLAIRSTALDTAAALATKVVVAKLSPASINTDATAAPASGPVLADPSANPTASPQDAQAASANAVVASADIFEPQVRSLGEPAAAMEATPIGDNSKSVTAAAAPSKPATDNANASSGGHDDALVF